VYFKIAYPSALTNNITDINDFAIAPPVKNKNYANIHSDTDKFIVKVITYYMD